MDYNYPRGVLNVHIFDEEFIRMFDAINKNCVAIVQVNSHLTEPFELQ